MTLTGRAPNRLPHDFEVKIIKEEMSHEGITFPEE